MFGCCFSTLDLLIRLQKGLVTNSFVCFETNGQLLQKGRPACVIAALMSSRVVCDKLHFHPRKTWENVSQRPKHCTKHRFSLCSFLPITEPPGPSGPGPKKNQALARPRHQSCATAWRSPHGLISSPYIPRPLCSTEDHCTSDPLQGVIWVIWYPAPNW